MSTNDAPPTPPPAPPEWIAAELPPEPPLIEPPSTEPAPPQPPRRGRATIAVAIIAAFLAAMIGGGLQARLRTRKSVPSATAAATASPSTSSAPAGPAAPADPTSPYPDNSGSSSGATTGSGTSTLSSAQAAAIAAKVDPGVVDINTKLGYQNASAAGTGVVLTASGETLTNNHVIDGATSITVTLVDTGRTYQASVVGTDPTEDIAVLQLQGASGLKTIKTASAAVAAGDSVVALGNAGGVGGIPSVVTGTVQAVNQTITASDQGGANAEQLIDLIRTDAPLQPGDSGGPLVNGAGQVIGIDTAASAGNQFASTATAGFAIPIAHAVAIAKQIESGTASATVHIGRPGFLGVAVVGNNAATTGTAGTTGAVVASVASGSPAAGAGLTQGDIITSINGQSLDSAQTLGTLTRSHRPGDNVTIGWSDQAGASHTAKISLATGPAD
jgi:S1-C subfamily serine protease